MAAQEVSGLWKRQAIPTAGAQVWGTGINRVHYHYGSDPLRTRQYNTREGEITPAWESVPESLETEQFWGYTPEDSNYTGVSYDDRSRWGTPVQETRMETHDQPSWAAPGFINERFRSRFGGAHRIFRGVMTTSQGPMAIGYQEPSETVSEGWRNKPQGNPANAEPSSDRQLIRQTSMLQRYQTRENVQAVERGTDVPRAPIQSKVTGQRLKIYSGGERHYDMFPKQQDLMIRPFWYRHAGTGRVEEMVPNTLWSMVPIERIPPGDPSIGESETSFPQTFGYSTEDAQYYAG
jgi:hypothetical protein